MIRLSEKTGQPEFTMFLNEQEQAEANIELRNLSSDNYFFDGGYSDAERKILCIHSEWDSTETIKLPFSSLATLTAPIGPSKGAPDNIKAQEAPNIAKVSGWFC